MSVYLTATQCSTLVSGKASTYEPAVPDVVWRRGLKRTKAADKEREAEGLLISSPVLHCILINLTDFSKMELTFHHSFPCEHFSLSLSRSIVLTLLAVPFIDLMPYHDVGCDEHTAEQGQCSQTLLSCQKLLPEASHL